MNLTKLWDKLLLASRGKAPGPHTGELTASQTPQLVDMPPIKIPGYAHDYCLLFCKELEDTIKCLFSTCTRNSLVIT